MTTPEDTAEDGSRRRRSRSTRKYAAVRDRARGRRIGRKMDALGNGDGHSDQCGQITPIFRAHLGDGASQIQSSGTQLPSVDALSCPPLLRSPD